jgi:hypothetical protein
MKVTIVLMSVCVALALGCAGSKKETKETAPAQEAQAAAPKPCDLFKQDCAEGEGCTMAGGQSVCVAVGTVAEGGACATGNDCSKGNFCTSDGCRRLCDDAHPCPKGSCQKFDNAPNLGACAEVSQ